MPINKTNWKNDYVSGTSANAPKLVREYVAATDKLAKMTSADAQKNFEDAMKDPKVLARRLSKLKKVTETDLNTAMQKKGEARYREGTDASADKALRNVTPFLDELDRLTPGLPARTRDGMQNLIKRAGPIVKGLQDLKERLG